MEQQKDYLTIANLEKFYGSFQALNNVSLTIKRGEFVCFLGPSGCGKTSLLRTIAGLEDISSGQIWQDGRDISTLPSSARDFGIVFQSYALFPNLSVIENVSFGLHNIKMPAKEAKNRALELLSMVDITEHALKYPAQLSGGQQQRVAVARALALSPGLLLLDEPLSALDAQVRVRLREELHDLQRHLGITTIMVTHDQDEAMSLADRIVVMNGGRIVQFDHPQKIYNQPVNRFVAEFVGDMNLIEAFVDQKHNINIGDTHIKLPAKDRIIPTGKLMIGIRPEDITLSKIKTPEHIFPGKIVAIEFLGAWITIRLETTIASGKTFRVRLSPSQLAEQNLKDSDEVFIALPLSALHLFSQQGQRL